MERRAGMELKPSRRAFVKTLTAGSVVAGSVKTPISASVIPDAPLEILFLGTGSPGIIPGEERGGACEIVFVGEEPLLFDCGHLALHNLTQAGMHPRAVRHLFFTHTFHYDHFCDFSAFAMIRALRQEGVEGGRGPLHVYGAADTQERIDTVLRDVYAEDVRAQGLIRRNSVQVHHADEGPAANDEGWEVSSTHVLHGPNALGYRIDADGKSVTITGDIAAPSADNPRRIVGFPCESIERLAEGTDVFVMDACARHSSPKELAAAAARVNPGRVVLTHVTNNNSAQRFRDEMVKAYKGEVIIAENQMRISV